MPITGVHALFFSDQADELRAFMRDSLPLSCKDTGGGWLIFDFAQADMGVHPVDPAGGPPSGTHDISFFCDDIETTVAEMRERGVTFRDEITEAEWGRMIHFTMPGDVKVLMYQPKYR